ncbi:unnamed protein product [Parnassius apollo]|uniref:(apollo) hypothetical protein n=1 Tax=Parnassius apollo TaxID=110799 RepID=A0A8S3YHI4_PARAO|nr:unnamed protein product [Parnassius apollo]
MRSALICVFFSLLIKGHVADDFRPTPIPLDEWHSDRRHGRAGTLHETIKTASPLTVVAIPAHYWEDALRHSVYLTLVRDKIDQLIAKGDIISPDTKFNHRGANNINDQDLWDKIKAAPFDRIREEEPTSYGDVTILARGRLMEESGGFRFAEDDKSHEKCDNDKCMEGVKAFWSVKRVRQRDQETSLGKYHYELTFSVMSQIPKKQNKPYEHPIRTFTVQESTNDRVPQTYERYHKSEIVSPQISRPERAIWVHKNIEQAPQYRKIQHQSGLDRLFSSLFDDYDDDEPSYDLPRRYKQNSYNPTYSQYSKIGTFGSSEQHSQIKTLPYPYKVQNVKYQGPPLTTSPIGLVHHHHMEHDISGGISNPYVSQTNYKITGFNNGQRTTHPAFLPTPLPSLAQPPKESNNKKNNLMKYDSLQNKTNSSEILTIHKQNSKNKTPTKVTYSPEHLRPPIYNAPPGVIVTMDKKPFKPMPPLKMPPSKSFRPKKPSDFRPSPQVLDVQFSEPDPIFDNVFRPITVNYAHNNYSTEKTLISEANEEDENKIRKQTVTSNKNPKKHDDIKMQRTTTYTPDIITSHNNSEQDNDMERADILGIFSKTIPMESQKEKSITLQTTTPIPSSTTVTASATTSKTTETSSTTSPSTTLKSKKRTRPLTKLNKSEKIKKHKRLTTTSTSTTTNTPLTTKVFEEGTEKTTQDLIAQASSTAIGPIKLKWQPSSKTTSTTPISSTGNTTTVSPTSTTKITTTTTKNVDGESVSSTARSRNINRFRQSALILKGTSVKHDRWSATKSTPERLRSSLTSSIYTKRRKGSKFHGYDSSTSKSGDKERRNQAHSDHGTSTKSYPITNEYLTKKTEVTSNITPVNEGSDAILTQNGNESDINEEKSQVFEESRDRNEYIFEKSSDTPINKNYEIIDNEETLTTDKIASTPSYFMPKIKKCKKKHQNLTTKKDDSYKINNEITTTSIPLTLFTTTTTTTTTTTKPLTTSIVEDLLKDFSFEDTNIEESPTTTLKSDLVKEQIQSKKQNLKIDEDLEELLDSLNNNDKYSESSDEEYKEDDEKESTFEEDDTAEIESADESRRHSRDDYENDEKHQFTLLELMGME